MGASSELHDSSELSVSQAARLLGVSVSSLRAWAAVGDVPHARTAGGHRRFRRDDLQRFLAAHGGSLPDGESVPARRLMGVRIPAHDAAAVIITARRDDIIASAERLDPAGETRAPRARAARRSRIAHLVDDLAMGVASGNLGDAVRLVDWWSYRAGAAGMPMCGPAGDVLAVSRAVDRAVASGGGSPGSIRAVRHACDRLVSASAIGFASGSGARWEVADVA
jgi:excisionase family DNA binding protein